MKKKEYLVDDAINIGEFIRFLWREKILILSISIICGLLGIWYASFRNQEFRQDFEIKIPSSQLFQIYQPYINKNFDIVERFNYEFKLNFLSIDNLQIFLEESKEFDNFKKYLKSKNISSSQYFRNRIVGLIEKNAIIPNKYLFIFTKELDGNIFLNNYASFIKKKTILNIKKNLRLVIEGHIFTIENAYTKAKLINLENPIQRSINEYVLVGSPNELFYKGTKILLEEINILKKLLLKLEEEQFNFEVILSQPFYEFKTKPYLNYFVVGLVMGLFFSLGIVFLKNILNNSQKNSII